MIAGRYLIAAFLILAMLPACAPTGARPVASTEGPAIRWEIDSAGKGFVAVTDIDRAILAKLRAGDWSQEKYAELFSVSVKTVEPPKAGRPRMLGRYRVDDSELRFQPLYPLDPGVRYEAIFHPDRLPAGDHGRYDLVRADFVRRIADAKPTRVLSVDPSGQVLPENLLKLYVHFSAPMARGSAYEHVQLLDESDKPVDLPFLEIGEELWDGSQTRLTLLFDPGRVKRGLKPREESGPILEAGRSYTFVVDRSWPDAQGRPLAADFLKKFRAGAADDVQPDPKSWVVSVPLAGSVDPLSITFPEPLDRALLEHAIGVVDPKKSLVSGRISVADDARRWRFTPDRAWEAGDWKMVVNTDLEDLCGNNIRRPFEVDATGPVSTRAVTEIVEIPFRPLTKRP